MIKITPNGFTTLIKVSLVLISENKNQPVFLFYLVFLDVFVHEYPRTLTSAPEH